MYTKIFNYKFVEEKPIEALGEFKDHRRLRVFCEKGCKCVSCKREGKKLILGEGRGSLHWDVYCEDGVPMTVDHIHPRSKGGSDHLDNLQPMCAYCNFKKGNGDELNGSYGHFCKWPKDKPGGAVKKENLIKTVVFDIGMEVWRKKDQNKVKYIGIISKIVTNPHTNELNYMVKGNETSMYNFQKTYIKKPL